MSEKDSPRRYSFKNVTENMTIHVRELRKSLSPGKEVEWEGVLKANTQSLVDAKFLEIKDIGPAKDVVDKVSESRKSLEKNVKEIVANQERPKIKDGGDVSAVKHDDDLSSAPPKSEGTKPSKSKSKSKSDRLTKLASKGTKGTE